MVWNVLGLLLGVALILGTAAVVVNFRGVIDYHIAGSQRTERELFGRTRSAQSAAGLKVLFHVIDRVIAIPLLMVGVMLAWATLQALLKG